MKIRINSGLSGVNLVLVSESEADTALLALINNGDLETRPTILMQNAADPVDYRSGEMIIELIPAGNK